VIDIVLPTVAGREADLERCIASYEANTAPDVLTFIVIHDEPNCGTAWIKGMEASTAPYVHLTADDLEVTSPTWAEASDRGLLPCPIVRRPNGSIESCGGDMSAPACLISELQENGTEVDFSPVPFGSREQVEAIGMIEAQYETDTYFSHKGRELGWPTVVCHGYEFTHHRSDVKRISPNPADHKLYVEAMNG
jgi:hypothetical protein